MGYVGGCSCSPFSDHAQARLWMRVDSRGQLPGSHRANEGIPSTWMAFGARDAQTWTNRGGYRTLKKKRTRWRDPVSAVDKSGRLWQYVRPQAVQLLIETGFLTPCPTRDTLLASADAKTIRSCPSSASSATGGDAMPHKARYLVLSFMLLIVALLAGVSFSPLWGQEGEHISCAISCLGLDGTTQLVETVEESEQPSTGHSAALSSDPPAYELLLLVNQERIARGIPALELAPALANSAQFHSDWMADHDCFDHNCPGEPEWTTRIAEAGYLDYRKLGETIAAGFTSANAVVNTWMNSPAHRSLLLDPGFRDAGGGYAYSSSSTYHHYWTLDLGARKERLPVVLIHGWHGPDDVEDSQLRHMRDWLDADGYDVYYATGITADRSLEQNAPILKAYIQYVKEDAHASRVIIIAHSRGGLNARAYVDSSLYEHDVEKVIMLGTPNAGVTLKYVDTGVGALFWMELLGIRDEDDLLSMLELQPEYMWFFNLRHRNSSSVPYCLVGGDAGPIPIPANDGLVTVASAHSASGNRNLYLRPPDVHGWWREPGDLGRSYVYPRNTYDACLRPLLDGSAPDPECNVSHGAGVSIAESSEQAVATPYQSGLISAGETVTHSIRVGATSSSQFHLVWDQGDLSLALLDPLGTTIDPAYADATPNVGFISFEPDTIINYNAYTIADTIAGTWTLSVTAEYTESVDVPFSTFATVEPTIELQVSPGKTLYGLNEPVTVTASLSYGPSGLPGANVEVLIGRPDVVTQTLALYDDGGHEDGLADDGSYGNTYVNTDVGGPYALFVTAEGLLDSVPYARADELTVQVSPETAQLAGNYDDYPEDADDNGRYEHLVTDVEVDVASAGDFLVSGILLGPGGEEIASTVHPISLPLGTQTVQLRFDGDLIYQSGLDGPYTLTQVFLLDSAGLPIKLDEAYDAWHTPAYEHTGFGLNEVTALPLALRNY
jgi:hypothetical protein